MGPKDVLIADDDPASAAYMQLALERENIRVRTCGGGIEALLAMERELPAAVVTDLRMPGMDGIELLAHVKGRWPDIPVVLVTVEQDVALVVEAVQRGALNFLIKPVAPVVLQRAIASALARGAAERASRGAESGHAAEIVGVSAAAVRIRHLVALAARSDANVLITGPTGAGKELVSRAIHRLSGGSSVPFVAHNCALTPPDLFESEFFGHRRGAFTGAERDHVGLLAQANGGILFLDELECLTRAHQAKLLRVIDDGQVRALGAEQARLVNVRFLAATNRSPQSMFQTEDLREDLYYRLRGLEIEIPALRERAEDIALIAAHFLRGTGKVLGTEALDALRRYSWPGNVRQLRSVLTQACLTTSGASIAARDLEIGGGGLPPVARAPAAGHDDLTLAGSERRIIVAALATHGHNLNRTAEALGIHRSTLRRKLRELDLEGGSRATKRKRPDR